MVTQIEFRNFTALPARKPCCQFFEAAETSRRFCQSLLAQSSGLGGAVIALGQVATERRNII